MLAQTGVRMSYIRELHIISDTISELPLYHAARHNSNHVYVSENRSTLAYSRVAFEFSPVFLLVSFGLKMIGLKRK
jgi:hypothetical protein